MQSNESSHGSQPTQCGYRVVHRRLVLGSPISPVPHAPNRRLACGLGPSACRVNSSGGSGCGESDSEGRSLDFGMLISECEEWGFRALGAEVRRFCRASAKSLRERKGRSTRYRGRGHECRLRNRARKVKRLSAGIGLSAPT